MNWVWIVWFAVTFGVCGIGGFAILEARAFKHPERQNTLSRTVYLIGSNFPLSIAAFWGLVGWLLGVLQAHFYWHWCPVGSVSTGMLYIPWIF